MSDRLRFAVEFANRKLLQLREGDLLNLRDDLKRFLGATSGSYSAGSKEWYFPVLDAGGILATPKPTHEDPEPDSYREKDFIRLQQDTKDLLLSLMENRKPGNRPRKFSVSYEFSFSPVGDRVFTHAEGETRQMFLLVLARQLSNQPIDKLQRCPECSSIFWKIRKQRFCSDTCATRAYMRKRRKDPDFRKSEADKAHQRYDKRMRKKGVKGKIQRRRRKRV